MSVKYKGRIRRKMSVKDLPVTRDEVVHVLHDYNADKFFVEYNGYFTNHLSQVCVALFHLGMSKEHFSSFVEHYILQLEPANGQTRRSQDDSIDLADTTVADLKGSRRGFYKIRQHYLILFSNKYNNTLVDLVRSEFPALALGISGASMHCLENLGYAYSIGVGELVCDALAYLHHSFCPNFMKIPRDISQLGRGNLPLVNVLHRLRDDFGLSNFLQREKHADWVLAKKLGTMMSSLVVLLQKRADVLMDYVHMIKAPVEVTRTAEDLADWIIDQFVMVYLASEARNDYQLLHAVTSTWALRQLLPAFSTNDSKNQFKMELLRVHLCNLLALYVGQKCPKLNMSLLDYPNVDRNTWDKLIEVILDMPVTTDEHIFKFVHVCYVRSMRNVDIRLGEIYKRAVRMCIESQGFHK